MANIWELAKQKVNEPPRKIGVDLDGKALNEDSQNGVAENVDLKQRDQSVVVVCGSKDSGKSSLILRFLDRNEQPKPTIALEYTYGRRTRGNRKDVGHIWELGGGHRLANLLEIAINAQNIEIISLVLVIDLSKPEELWHCMSDLLNTGRKRVDNILSADSKLKTEMNSAAWARIGLEHKDKEILKPFPIPLAFVGAKYDIFQDFESEKKKAMCKTLRFMAHLNGASLLFYSSKMENLVMRGRALMSHLVFDTNPSKGIAVDYNKPLFVSAGGDSLAEIGTPPLLNDDLLTTIQAKDPVQLWKAAFEANFPQKETNDIIGEDPAKDEQYKEEVIDKLRAQKDQELERYIKEKKNETEQMMNIVQPNTLAPKEASPQASPRSPPPQQEDKELEESQRKMSDSKPGSASSTKSQTRRPESAAEQQSLRLRKSSDASNASSKGLTQPNDYTMDAENNKSVEKEAEEEEREEGEEEEEQAEASLAEQLTNNNSQIPQPAQDEE